MLLTRIKVKNFYGIKEAVEVKFIEGGKVEKSGYCNTKDDARISLINGFYGANASGKSTILNAIDMAICMMLFKRQEFFISPTGIQEETIICLPNYHVDMDFCPTELEIDFILEEDKYVYKISIINGGKVETEELFRNSVKIFKRKDNLVVFPENKYKYLENEFKDYVLPKKSSFLSLLIDGRMNLKGLEEAVGLESIRGISDKMCFITDKRAVKFGQGNISGLFAVLFNYINNPNIDKKKFLDNINSVTRYFEPSLEEVVMKQIETKNLGSPEGEYGMKYKDCDKLLPITEASAGTRELISYINNILKVLKNGGLIIYDETSKYYHPDMEIAILNLFRDKDINRNNAQIFFSSHNHETFDLLHNSQAHIMERNGDTITVSKVSDYDVQERDNVKRRYRLGSLGGIPDTIDFNRVINNLL
jgi:hypothetical protein